MRNPDEADWQSAREGSDTLIIPASQLAEGDTLYITVRCINECTYDLRSYSAREYEVVDGERTLFRWGGHATNIVKYKVLDTSSNGPTQKFDIHVEPEVDYQFVQVFLSHGKCLAIPSLPLSFRRAPSSRVSLSDLVYCFAFFDG